MSLSAQALAALFTETTRVRVCGVPPFHVSDDGDAWSLLSFRSNNETTSTGAPAVTVKLFRLIGEAVVLIKFVEPSCRVIWARRGLHHRSPMTTMPQAAIPPVF